MDNRKEYRLNKDYMIECIFGEKMSVRVIMVSVPFEPVMEEYVNIADKNEANQIFKNMVQKYKMGVTFI